MEQMAWTNSTRLTDVTLDLSSFGSLAPVPDAQQCRACGDTLATDHQTCDQCESPHHHRCWDARGGCAVFGCARPASASRRSTFPVLMQTFFWSFVALAAVEAGALAVSGRLLGY